MGMIVIPAGSIAGDEWLLRLKFYKVPERVVDGRVPLEFGLTNGFGSPVVPPLETSSKWMVSCTIVGEVGEVPLVRDGNRWVGEVDLRGRRGPVDVLARVAEADVPLIRS